MGEQIPTDFHYDFLQDVHIIVAGLKSDFGTTFPSFCSFVKHLNMT